MMYKKVVYKFFIIVSFLIVFIIWMSYLFIASDREITNYKIVELNKNIASLSPVIEANTRYHLNRIKIEIIIKKKEFKDKDKKIILELVQKCFTYKTTVFIMGELDQALIDKPLPNIEIEFAYQDKNAVNGLNVFCSFLGSVSEDIIIPEISVYEWKEE